MRALQLLSPGVLEVRDVPTPTIGSDEVLVRVVGAGICHSDVRVRYRENPAFAVPLTLGHETAGHVAAIGDDVTGFAEGDAVLVYLVWACGRCRACVSGKDNVCEALAGRHGYPPTPGLGPAGGMAEYMKVNARFLEPLGDLDPVRAAPLADAGLTPMHAINGARHRLTPGGTAMVIGLGGLGHVGLQILAATTGVRIIALDTDEQKLALAREHGADIALRSEESAVEEILDLTNGYGVDASFDFVGAQTTIDIAAQTIAPDGALRLVGLGGGTLAYAADSSTQVLPWGVDVRRSFGGTRIDQRQILDLARRGKVRVDTVPYELEDAVRAFDDLEAGRVLGRAVITPW